MTARLTHGINAVIGRWLPERRLFLKSDSQTRFIRLRPATQALMLGGGGLVLGWTIVASSLVAMQWVSSGNIRERSMREQVAYETRINVIAAERDQRAGDAAAAEQRFDLALGQVSAMQSRLLASEEGRKELSTGIDAMQSTLRRALRERDEARGETRVLEARLSGDEAGEAGRARDTAATLDVVTATLNETAGERDRIAGEAARAKTEAETLALELRLAEERHDQVLSRLEEAVSVSMAPLDKMFRAAGVSSDKVLNQIRRGYSGQGGPLGAIAYSTKGVAIDSATERANGILTTLDEMNMYRIAAQKLPLSNPLKTSYRFTSGFGGRSDPFRRGYRRHTGVDFAGAYGSPIHSTGDGVVVKAGWASGYGQMVQIQHDFGLETLYGHMSKIRVKVGQKVSRGERIGDMGSTGRSTGTHLHYEVRVGGTPVNPMTYIMAAKDVF